MNKNFWIRFIFLQTILVLFNFANANDTTNKIIPINMPIKVGMTTALSGPAENLGQSMKEGINTYFKRVNDQGGIDGKKIQLITLDDQYEPSLAGPNMRELIETDNVIAVIGNVGTPTAVVTVLIANQQKVLLFAPFSGAGILRKTPPDRYIFNLRASYAEETAAMIKGLLSIGIKPDEMAFFTQNDAYGDSGYAGAMNALKAAGYAHPEELPYGRYNRNTLNVEQGLGEIVASPHHIRAIIIVGAYAPSAKFIKLAQVSFPNAIFLNVSFVGARTLATQLGKDDTNVVVTQVVPFFNKKLAAISAYETDLKKYYPHSEPDFGSLEGYLAAKLFVLGLETASKENKLNREGLIDVFESMKNVDIGIGQTISFDKNNHQALHTVWPTLIKDGIIMPLSNWSILSSEKLKKPASRHIFSFQLVK